MDVQELIERARVGAGLPSRAALARRLGLPEKSVQRWQSGRNTPDDSTTERLAELAGVDADLALLSVAAARSPDRGGFERWQRIAARLQSSAAAVVAVILSALVSGTPDAWAASVERAPAAVESRVHPLYIVRCCVASAVALRRVVACFIGAALAPIPVR